MTIANFDDLLADVKANGGVVTIGMWKLRNLQGAGKLGTRVIEKIDSELAKRGLRHLPAVLLPDQHEPVRIFLGAGQVGKLIEAAHEISPNADDVLRGYAEAASGSLRERIEEVIKLADVLGPSNPDFDMKRFSDELSGEAS
ncbi:MAG: hypothetical protein ABL957_04885 [Parvularculaceae bacterium]